MVRFLVAEAFGTGPREVDFGARPGFRLAALHGIARFATDTAFILRFTRHVTRRALTCELGGTGSSGATLSQIASNACHSTIDGKGKIPQDLARVFRLTVDCLSLTPIRQTSGASFLHTALRLHACRAGSSRRRLGFPQRKASCFRDGRISTVGSGADVGCWSR